MPTGYRSITVDNKEGKAAYELKVATSGDHQGEVQIEQKTISFTQPHVPLDELTSAVAWLNGEGHG